MRKFENSLERNFGEFEMKSVQFFANSFAASVALIFGFRAFAGLIDSGPAYSAPSFFSGGMLVANIISVILVACALRARYETADTSLRLWCENVVLTIATFTLASVVVITFMASMLVGILTSVAGFVIYSLMLRELRDSIKGYANGKEFGLVPTMALAILGTAGTGFLIDDHPFVAFVVMCLLMYFSAAASLSDFFGAVAVPKNARGVMVEMGPVAEPQKHASDATGQVVDKRV